jgi:predicted Holliday junction resolvase-like endonuclease
MEFDKFIIAFYQEQQHIFGICPCCTNVFQLSECAISVKGKKITIPEVKEITNLQNQVARLEERIGDLDGKLYDQQDKYTELEQEIKDMESHVTKRYRNAGRKQALKQISKVDKVFTKRNIDPRDIRLIFNPVEYVAFNGLTEQEVQSISFVTKQMQNSRQEIAINSLEKTIKSGNLEFVIIRIDENGQITYKRED